MAFEQERWSLPARWSRRIAGFAAVLLAVSALFHRFGFIETVPLFWLVGIVGALALLALGLAYLGFADIWQNACRGVSDTVFGALLAILVLLPYLFGLYQFFAHPALNDISTDWADPPSLAAARTLRDATMNPVAVAAPEDIAVQESWYPAITGRRYEMTADRVATIALGLVEAKGWSILRPVGPNATALVSPAVTIEAVAYSPILALASDVAIRVTDEEITSYVDMRSASRYGLHDLGDNARRIAAFLSDLDAEVAAQAGLTPPEPVDPESSEQIPIPEPAPTGD